MPKMPKLWEVHPLLLENTGGADESPKGLLGPAAQIQEFQTRLIIQHAICSAVTDPAVYNATLHG